MEVSFLVLGGVLGLRQASNDFRAQKACQQADMQLGYRSEMEVRFGFEIWDAPHVVGDRSCIVWQRDTWKLGHMVDGLGCRVYDPKFMVFGDGAEGLSDI